MVREIKEEGRLRQAEVFERRSETELFESSFRFFFEFELACLCPCFFLFQFEHCVPSSEYRLCASLFFVCSSEGRKEGMHHLLNEVFEGELFQCVDFVSACV